MEHVDREGNEIKVQAPRLLPDGTPMWNTHKPFWQQEEGYLATQALWKVTGDRRYKIASDQTLQFCDRFVLDRCYEPAPNGKPVEVSRGDRAAVAADGSPVDEPRGGPGKSSYHATEMAVLAQEIDGW